MAMIGNKKTPFVLRGGCQDVAETGDVSKQSISQSETERKLNFKTVSEAQAEAKELIRGVDAKMAVMKTDVEDILMELERHIISRNDAMWYIRERFADEISGVPIVEEKYGDADDFKLLENAFSVCCDVLADFDTCPANAYCPHYEDSITCEECWKVYITKMVAERRKHEVQS